MVGMLSLVFMTYWQIKLNYDDYDDSLKKFVNLPIKFVNSVYEV